jgi:peptidoglycan/xylan/chitin deacetylase (PgdA/CDA1 family)
MLTVAMYHYVRDLANSRYPLIKGLDIRLFKEQIKFLQAYYTLVRIEDLLEKIYVGKPLPEKAALLTFDDAYIDHYTFVFPLLDKFKLQGCFYAPVKSLTEHKALDVNKIHFILASSKVEDIMQELRDMLPAFRNEAEVLEFEDYYYTLAKPAKFDTKEVIFIKRLLQHALPSSVRGIIVNDLFKKFVGISENIFSRELYMNEDQIKTMHRKGMHFGGHGFDHYWMDKLAFEKQDSEIQKTKGFLISIGLSEDSLTYCYPYGAFNDDSITALKNNGFSAAFTTETNVVKNIDAIDPFRIPRLDTNDLPKDSKTTPDKWYK